MKQSIHIILSLLQSEFCLVTAFSVKRIRLNEDLTIFVLGLQNYAVCRNVIIISQSNEITNAKSLFLTNRELKLFHLFFPKILENATCAYVDSFVVSPPPELEVKLLAHSEQYYEEKRNACGEGAICFEYLEGLQ